MRFIRGKIAKPILIWTALIFFVLSLTSCNKISKEKFDIESVGNYKSIPGITTQEIAAIEELKTKKESFSYGHLAVTEAFMLPDGSYGGFTYKFCDLLTKLFDIKFVPQHYDSWHYMKTSLDQKEVDFLGDITSMPERMPIYYMTHAIAERSLRIFTHQGNDEIKTESDINGRMIGFLTGTITANYIKKSYPLIFESIDVETFAEAAEKIESGEIDAFIVDSVADVAFEKYDFIKSREFFPLVYTPVSMTTANPEFEPIISAVNKFLIAGGIDKLYTLYKEGDYEYTKNKLNKSFTPEERIYLENLAARGGKVGIAFEHDNYPVCFYNEKDQEFQGIAVDIIKQISQLANIEFEIKTKKDTPWFEILEMLKNGEVSMVTQLLYSDARKDNFIWANTPYAFSYYALVSKWDYPHLAIYQIVRSKVGNVTKTAYEDMYNEWFPNSNNVVNYDTHDIALDALERGDIDLLMASEYMLLNQLNYREKPGYKINVHFNQPMHSVFGFNKNEKILCSIINKTLSCIKTNNISQNWVNRTFDYSKKLAQQRAEFLLMIIILLLSVLTVVIFLFLKNRRLGKDLARQTEEAQVASKAKSSFLARMSHEIRTPLNAIVGMSNIAKNSITNQDKAISSINQIVSSSNHLLGLLNDVLDMSKIESGKLEIAHEPFSMLEAYNEVSAIIIQRCLDKNINFITNINEIKDLAVIGDKLRLNQVLVNLLGNAVKFTDNDGKIEFLVSILNETDKKILIEYSICDNGIGMSMDQIERLFIPFEQTDNSISARFGGTGLGLSISQNLVNMMGGEIKVKSKPGIGTKFYFKLNFEKGHLPDDTPTQMPDLIDLKGKRILIVEDIEINRLIICECLAETGVEIHEAEDGQNAVDIFASTPSGYYDLIYMDVQMPVMGGYEATKKIRALNHADAKTVPIVAMTANAYQEDINDALASGMDGHLAKPIDIEALMKSLVDFILMKDKA